MDCEICRKMKTGTMNCPDCSGTEIRRGAKRIEPDGTEYFELTCKSCNHRFMDLKLPYSALLKEAASQEVKSPEMLVHTLIESGLNVDKALVEEISNTPETVPLLIELLKDEQQWQRDFWPPLHALCLLSAMKVQAAVPILIDFLKKDPDMFGDWLTETIPSLLFNFGKDSMGYLIELLKDKSADTFARNAASRALASLVYYNKDVKPLVIQAYTELLQDALDNKEDNELIAFSVEEASSLQDEELFSLVKKAFEKGLVANDITELHYSEESFKTGLPHALDKDTEDPLKHFDRDNINYLLKVNQPEMLKKRKIGRNELCPCGSGKKYKKCCLES